MLGLNCDLKNCMWLMHLTASAPDVQEPILKYLVHINDIHVLDSVFKPVKCKHHKTHHFCKFGEVGQEVR